MIMRWMVVLAVLMALGCDYDDDFDQPDFAVSDQCFPHTRADLDALVRDEDGPGDRCIVADDRAICAIDGIGHLILFGSLGEPARVYAQSRYIPPCD